MRRPCFQLERRGYAGLVRLRSSVSVLRLVVGDRLRQAGVFLAGLVAADLFQGGQLQPVLDEQGQLQTNPPANTFGLTAEPWVFVVDRTGTVTASLEVIFTDKELTTALDAVK